MGIVERIKEKAAIKKISLNKLEIEAGLGHSTIARWNKNAPTIDKVVAVAEILESSIEYLIIGKESESLTNEERKLIELYRNCNRIGKDSIMVQAEYHGNQNRVSTSKDGKTGTFDS